VASPAVSASSRANGAVGPATLPVVFRLVRLDLLLLLDCGLKR
jgi:hypothetical protein